MKLKSFNYKTEYIKKMKEKGYEYSKKILGRLLKHKTKEDMRMEAKHIVLEEYIVRRQINSLDTLPTRFNRIFKKRRNRENNIINIRDF